MDSKPPVPDAGLAGIVEAMLASYDGDARARHVDRGPLPSRDEIVDIVGLLIELAYPGYHGSKPIQRDDLRYHTGVLLSDLRDRLGRQIEACLCYSREVNRDLEGGPAPCVGEAARLTARFLAQLPEIRATLIADVQAAYDGDPAATNLDEIILAYPGLLAVTVYRFAHALHELGVALMPRIMTEWAHARTGCDIHPGATIERGFFIDHATGVVIGETATIGASVKLYQGVTLGALSHPKDVRGRVIRGTKRHPTVDDGVTIYANATVLGGETVVGSGSVVGGSVFLTHSVPARSRVAVKPPELRVKEGEIASDADGFLDFEI